MAKSTETRLHDEQAAFGSEHPQSAAFDFCSIIIITILIIIILAVIIIIVIIIMNEVFHVR